MVFITSLSPGHSNSDNQVHSLESWKPYGKIYSLNTPIEIEQIRLIYQNSVTFIPTEKTIKHIVKKDLVTINALIDFGITIGEDVVLINSDILIDKLPEFKQDGMTILSRYDYTDHFGDAKIFNSGFDLFHIPKKFLNVFPHSIYALGLSWWDYSIVLRFFERNIPVYWPQEKYIYHKLHPTQYSIEEWLYVGDIFRIEFKVEKHYNTGQVATKYLNEIKTKAIK